jgi:hypothetical protein
MERKQGTCVHEATVTEVKSRAENCSHRGLDSESGGFDLNLLERPQHRTLHPGDNAIPGPRKEEVVMRWLSFRAPTSGTDRRRDGRVSRWAFISASAALLALGGSAQIQPPSHAPKPLIIPAANPTPDANDQMALRQKNLKTRNFDMANTERLREMMKASDLLETLAMALKAQMDKPGPLSLDEVHKAEDIEKLAHMVKEKMKLTIGPN